MGPGNAATAVGFPSDERFGCSVRRPSLLVWAVWLSAALPGRRGWSGLACGGVPGPLGVMSMRVSRHAVASSVRRSCAVRFACAVAAGTVAAGVAAPASADVLFYSGDWATNLALVPNYLNLNNNFPPFTPFFDRSYQGFVISGPAWTVDGLFLTGVLQDPETIAGITRAYYEVRSGVAEGNGGTLVRSGELNVSVTPTGRNFFGSPEVRIAGSLPEAFELSEGTWFITLTPFSATNNRALIASTTGLNAVGTAAGSFRNSNFFTSLNFSSSFRVSLGVEGTAGDPPCPADFNGDTTPGDIFDLFDFLAALDSGLDFNADTATSDIFDLFDFLSVLDQGCP